VNFQPFKTDFSKAINSFTSIGVLLLCMTSPIRKREEKAYHVVITL